MIRLPEIWAAILLTCIGIALAPMIQPAWVFALMTVLVSGIFYFIDRTRYPAIGIGILAILYGTGIISIVVFTGTLAIIILGEAAFRIADRGALSYIPYIIVATAASLLCMLYLNYQAPLIAVTGVIVAVLLKSALKTRQDVMMIQTLGVAMTMFLFEDLDFQVDLMLLLTAVIIAFTFGYFSYRLKAADLSGLFSGALLGILLIVFADVRWFFIMLIFFILGSVFTHYKFDKKTEMGVAESHGGVRGYFNVFANGLVSVAGAVIFGVTGHPAAVALFLGSVASAAADTTASEIGVVGKTPYLITTLKKVPRGTNGGVTLVGEVAATAASAVICICAWAMGVVDPGMALICTVAGFVGTNADSLIGATLENSGKIGNAGTNFFSTLAAGIFAALFYLF